MSYEDSNTYKEINSQILSWHHIYKDITEKNQVELKIFKKKYDKIIICGCGSSYNLSQSAAFFTQSILKDCNIVAVPSSEILLNPDLFINKKKRSLLIGFSRSGETTETLEVFKKFSCNDNIVSFTFSGQNFSSLTKLSDSYYVCKKAKEKSIVMTVSFSSMLFAYCLIIAATYCEKILNDFEKLLGYLDKKLSYLNTAIEEFIYSNNFNNYFVLGSGFNYGIAVEADLKMKEMSQTPSYAYHIYEFSHGPKSLVTDETLSVILTLGSRLFKKESILKELISLNSKIIIIGNKIIFKHEQKNINNIFEDCDIKNDIVKSFINIPVVQLLAFYKTVSLNLNPDLPKNLAYTVKI